jgi:hypothetical protein
MFCHGAGARPTTAAKRDPGCRLDIEPRAEYVQRQVDGVRSEHCVACGRAFFGQFLD